MKPGFPDRKQYISNKRKDVQSDTRLRCVHAIRLIESKTTGQALLSTFHFPASVVAFHHVLQHATHRVCMFCAYTRACIQSRGLQHKGGRRKDV